MSFLATAPLEPRITDAQNVQALLSREARDAAALAFSELAAVFEDGGAKMVLNLATDQADEGLATTLGHLQASVGALAVASLLSTKAFMASQGHCVVPEALRAEMESYTRYAEGQGLVPIGSSTNMLFVQNPLHYRIVLGLLAQLGKDVVPYMDCDGFAQLAAEQSVSVRGSSPQSAALVTQYADKSALRDFLLKEVVDAAGSLKIRGFLDYPRIVLRRGVEHDSGQLARELDDAVEYYSPDKRTDTRVLFVQVADAAGGNGNTVVYRTEGGYRFRNFDGQERVCANIEALAKEIDSLTRTLDIEVTPFLDLTRSYSISIMVSDAGVSLLGPRTQVLDPETHAFLASNFDCEARAESFVQLEQMMAIAIAFGQELAERGFRGHTDLDVIEYRHPDGEQRVSVSESNMRRNAPSHLIALVLQHAELSRRLVEGRLSFILDDHVNLGCGEHSAESLAELLAKGGVPLLSATQREGLVLMSPPLRYREGDIQHLSLGVIAESDARKHELYRQARAILGGKE